MTTNHQGIVTRNLAAGLVGVSILGSKHQVPETSLEDPRAALYDALKLFKNEMSGSVTHFLHDNILLAITKNALVTSSRKVIDAAIQTDQKMDDFFRTDITGTDGDSTTNETKYFDIHDNPKTGGLLFDQATEISTYTILASSTIGPTPHPDVSIILEEGADLSAYLHDFTAQYGPEGILSIVHLFVGAEHDERRRELIGLLGEERSPATHQVRRQILLEVLEGEVAGDRLAAASALGRLADPSTLPTLRNQAGLEASRFAKSVMVANIQALEQHAASTQATG
jgi:hypothetical protein